ncbi:hypothetical protein CK203_097457 [Vitis vinifera]|uniref:Uncharacterized protein n=1 Tax=Vitis vinifera TaxID=29760 RepID=A0A438BTR6_VITVI|nr:hypothetical protein CK203_097457 [Vitis vinifera]
MKDVVEVNKQSVQAVVDPTEKVEWATSSGLKESETVKPPSMSSGLLIPEMSQIVEGNNPLLVDIGPPGKMGISEGTYFVPPSDQSGNIMDLLTGDEWNASHVPCEKQEGEWNLSSGISSFANPPLLVESLKSTNEDLGSKVDAAPQKREEMVDADRKLHLQQESLSHKRSALKLRREGRIEEAEAEFELAKALETQLEELAAHDAAKSSAKEPAKLHISKSDSSSQEKGQLEERIKAEKVKAVNLNVQESKLRPWMLFDGPKCLKRSSTL